MKTLEQWLQEYDSHHQEPSNILIHNIFVPLITISVFGILWGIRIPIYDDISVSLLIPFLLGGLFFYRKLGEKPFVIMTIVSALIILSFIVLENFMSITSTSVLIFIIGWVFQYYGHRIEGNKPSFFKDLQFLFIGPLWVMMKFLKKINL